MKLQHRIATLTIVAVLFVSACTSSRKTSKTGSVKSGFNAATSGVVNPSNKSGGVIRVGTTNGCSNWDPATTYGGTCYSLHRLLSRTLVGFGMTGLVDKPGNGAKLYGDLATGLGKANGDKTRWTYTLRGNLKFATGDSITSADIKYGFERMYATAVISGGPEGYYLCVLNTCDKAGTPQYKGPYTTPNADLTSIQTPDPKTIVFHLNKPVGDWDYLMALPAAAPVPKKYDKAGQYGAGTNLVASGPYMLQSSDPHRSAVLVRNPQWAKDSDVIRRALPDKINVTVLSNPDDLDSRLKNGSLDLSLDGGVQTTFQSEIINGTRLKANADDPVSTAMYMLTLYPWDPALQNVHCRRAVAYAVDKRDMLVQAGGRYGGAYSTTLLPPGLPGYDKNANAYPSGPDWTGDLVKAKSELAQCGKPNGFHTVVGYGNASFYPQSFAALQAALGRVGITVTGRQIDIGSLYQTLSTPASVKSQHYGIAAQPWQPDYPSGNGFLTLLVDGSRFTGTSSSSNFVGLNDPSINALVKQAQSASIDKQAEIYRGMDAKTMQTAYYIPLLNLKLLLYRNPRLTNVDLTGFGPADSYDLVNLGVGRA